MTASKSPRQKALSGLKRLSSDRVDRDGNLGDIYHWGILEGSGRDSVHDRATAITASAVVEHGLEYAILTQLHRKGPDARDKLFEGKAAILRDFSAKITLAHAMGILGDDSRSDISMIRHIRNTFAHCRHAMDFDTPEISEACAQITLMRRLEERGQGSRHKHLREDFIQSCFEFSLWLFTIDEPRPEGAVSDPPRAHLGR